MSYCPPFDEFGVYVVCTACTWQHLIRSSGAVELPHAPTSASSSHIQAGLTLIHTDRTRAVQPVSPRAVPRTSHTHVWLPTCNHYTLHHTHPRPHSHETRSLPPLHRAPCVPPLQHGGESRFWSLDAPPGNYDGIGANGLPIVPPAGFSWSHSLANITLTQPWESFFFIDRKVRACARRVSRCPPPLPPL